MRVDFYHLLNSPLDKVLPTLAERVYALDKRLLIKTSLIEQAEYVNTLLWTYRNDSWLPHGTENDGNEADQPVFITTQDVNPNGASVIMLLDGGTVDEISGFERCLNLFNGRDEGSVQAARELWKAVVAAGFEAYYWQQDERGKWEMKASKLPESK